MLHLSKSGTTESCEPRKMALIEQFVQKLAFNNICVIRF